jgi:hypothetical protein
MSHFRHDLHTPIVCPPGRNGLERYARRRLWGWIGEKIAGPKGRQHGEQLADLVASLDRLVVYNHPPR